MTDNVNNPKHYQILPGVEVKDVRKALLDSAESSQYNPTFNQVDYWSRAWEYLTRMWGKNGLEDAEKAAVYLRWLIEDLKQQHVVRSTMKAGTLEEAYDQAYIIKNGGIL